MLLAGLPLQVLAARERVQLTRIRLIHADDQLISRHVRRERRLQRAAFRVGCIAARHPGTSTSTSEALVCGSVEQCSCRARAVLI